MNWHTNVFCKWLRVDYILCECCTKHHIEKHNHMLQYILKLFTWFALWGVLLVLVIGHYINILRNRYHSTETYRQTGPIKAPQADYIMTTNNTHWTLTHWGRATHICVGKLTPIGYDNGLSPGRRQAIIWTIAGILLIGPLETNFSEILIEIQTFSFKKMHFKMASAKWRQFVSASMC